MFFWYHLKLQQFFRVVFPFVILVGDFDINVPEFDQNKKVQNFVKLMFQFSLVPTINQPTRATNKTICN